MYGWVCMLGLIDVRCSIFDVQFSMFGFDVRFSMFDVRFWYLKVWFVRSGGSSARCDRCSMQSMFNAIDVRYNQYSIQLMFDA